MQQEIELTVNGKTKKCPTGITLADYLKNNGVDTKKVVAEVNNKIIAPESLSEHVLNAGDQVEIIQFVGGG